MSLTPADVSRIARLARLELNEQEQATALNELNSMLGLIEQLQSVDTSGVHPLAHPLSVHEEVSLRLREDVVTETPSEETRALLMSNTPAESEGLFLVPKVIE